MHRSLLVSLLSICSCFVVSTALHCVPAGSRSLKLSLSSRRNSTGNWVAQVTLGHGAGSKDSGPWDVDVDHTTASCDSQDSVQIAATLSVPTSSPKPPPAAGYDLVAGFGYYKLHTDAKTWHEALAACEEEGAHLAVINSEAEAAALGPFWDMNPKILDGAANNWAHVGFHDQYKEGQYLTIFNQSLVAAGYVKWNAGEPSGPGSNCGVVIRRSNVLADITCSAKQPFFCEFEL